MTGIRDETGSSSMAVNLQIILTPRRKQQLMKPENEGDAGRFMSQVFLRKWNQSTRRFPWKHLYEQQMRWRDNVSCLQTAHSLIRQNHCDLTLLCSTSPLWQNTAGFMKINIWRGIISAGFKVGKFLARWAQVCRARSCITVVTLSAPIEDAKNIYMSNICLCVFTIRCFAQNLNKLKNMSFCQSSSSLST